MYNNVLMEAQFPLVLFTKLMTETGHHRSRRMSGKRSPYNGNVHARLLHIQQISPVSINIVFIHSFKVLAKNLQALLDYGDNVEDDLALTFQVRT